MDPDDLREPIRAALDSRLVPSPGLESRVLAALDRPGDTARTWPRAAGFVAAGLTVLVVAGAVTLWSRGALSTPAGRPQAPPGFRVTQFTASGGGWVLVSSYVGPGPHFEVALDRTDDGGATWHEQLRMHGYDQGLRADPDGQHAVAWITDVLARPCPTPPRPLPRSTAPSGTCSSGSVVRVYQTADAGEHWTAAAAAPPGELGTFLDTRHGWAVNGGAQGWTVSRTDDGGKTWAQVGQVPPMQVVSDGSLGFTDADTGWLALGGHAAPGRTNMMVTRDGGRTWTELTVPAPAFAVTWEMVEEPPAMAGDRGVLVLLAHRDRGPAAASPASATSPSPSRDPADQADTIDSFLLSTTQDGGRTWSAPVEPAQVPAGAMVNAQFLLDGRRWWLSSLGRMSDPYTGNGTLYVTRDAGATWSAYRTPAIIDMTFVDDRDGWAVANPGRQGGPERLLHTTDGGATWAAVPTPPDPARTSGPAAP
jgi:photosystem II stability/assembly factor-like uncharacterized protein